MVREQGVALELFPVEFRIRLAAHQKEAIALIDLREVHRKRLDPTFPRLPVGGYRRLHNVDLAVAKESVAPLAWPEHTVIRFAAFLA
jgi:hypothetical protein